MVLHGVKRRAKGAPVDVKAEQAKKEKAELYGALQSGVIARVKAGLLDQESLDASAKLLQLNPDVYTAWNFRKKILTHLLEASKDDEAARQALLEGDLALVEKALRANPKSYGAWYHRKWLVQKGESSLPREMKLCGMLLKMDERNFHGWDYRRFVVALAGIPDEDELAYTTEKIESNFSNYSAWHNRSKLLLSMHGDNIPSEVLEEEFELVKQALFTEPDDQSGWLYHRWLVGQATGAGAGAGAGGAGAARGVLEREADMCKELLDVEPESKWALLTRSYLLLLARGAAGAAGAGEGGDIAGELDLLARIDPDRARYYSHLRGVGGGGGGL